MELDSNPPPLGIQSQRSSLITLSKLRSGYIYAQLVDNSLNCAPHIYTRNSLGTPLPKCQSEPNLSPTAPPPGYLAGRVFIHVRVSSAGRAQVRTTQRAQPAVSRRVAASSQPCAFLDASWRWARPQCWPLVHVLTADARIAMQQSVRQLHHQHGPRLWCDRRRRRCPYRGRSMGRRQPGL